MMIKVAGFKFLVWTLAAGNAVVAGDASLATGQHASAVLVRRVTRSSSSPASATEAISATTAVTSPAGAGLAPTNALPPLPSGVSDLSFSEFFRQPVGARGLELTETLRRRDGQRVRLVGFMVREHDPNRAGSFLLASRPVTLDEAEFGLCDDLPASAVLVQVPQRAKEIIPYQSGRVIVTGTLSVGAHAEASGRVFLARLTQDDVTPAP